MSAAPGCGIQVCAIQVYVIQVYAIQVCRKWSDGLALGS